MRTREKTSALDKVLDFIAILIVVVFFLWLFIWMWSKTEAYDNVSWVDVSDSINVEQRYWTLEEWDSEAELNTLYGKKVRCNSITNKCYIRYSINNKTYKFRVAPDRETMIVREYSLFLTSWDTLNLSTDINKTIYINILLIKKWLQPIYK
jgi:hypothetical protein